MDFRMSYGIKITGQNKIFTKTVSVYRDALAFIIKAADAHFEDIDGMKPKEKVNHIEHLIHNTSRNTAVYDFDALFVKFPSYYRRAAIQKAIGIVSSYKSNYANWSNHKKGKPPKLSYTHYAMPALYNKGSFLRTGSYEARIKIYNGRDWVWATVKLGRSDADYILKNCADFKESAPVLEKRHKRYHLRFMYNKKIVLHNIDPANKKDVIIGVDLGVNNACALAAVHPDGTVIGRKILSLPKEKDRLRKSLNYIKKAQQNGNPKTPRLWAYSKNINYGISCKTANAVMGFARKYGAKAIVFEFLDFRGRKKGSRKQRLHMWRKQEVQNIVTVHAHKEGTRISRICAWGTSRTAFDGSGRVKRCGNNHSLCVFPSGKKYHADLNAAYNIGARYYIREILKSLPETARLEAAAKVPSVSNRLTCGLSDLIDLNAELVAMAS